MDGTFLVGSGAAGQQADAGMRHLSGNDDDWIRIPVVPPCQSSDLRTVEPAFDLPRAHRLSTMLEAEPVQPRHDRAPQDPHVAPSPDTVVASSLRHTIAREQRAKLREAMIGAKHATEMARLISTIEGQKTSHAAEIVRLRAEHADELRRAIEAEWRTRDSARAVLERPIDLDEKAAVGKQAQSPTRLLPRREWLASILGGG